MMPEFAYTVQALFLDYRIELGDKHFSLCGIGRLVIFASLESAHYLIKHPRRAIGTAADHNAVATRFFPHRDIIVERSNVAVADNGYRNGIFDLFDNFSVRTSRIHLGACSSVDENGTCAAALARKRDIDRRFGLIVVAGLAEFCGYGNLDRLDYRRNDLLAKLGVAHKRASFSVLVKLRHGASHIYIDIIGRKAHHKLCGVRHNFGIAAEYLYRGDALVVEHPCERIGLAVAVIRALCAY